jgi:hypothetical protein
MNTDTDTDTEIDARVRKLAESLDCITEEDFCLLAGILPSTGEAWRKRGQGPAFVRMGNRYLYPRASVAEYLQGLVRERTPLSAKGLL